MESWRRGATIFIGWSEKTLMIREHLGADLKGAREEVM